MSCDVQVSVVGFRCDSQQVAHQWVDVDSFKWLHLQILLEVWPHGPKKRLHVQSLVIIAVLSLIELHWEILQKNKEIE